MPPLLRRILKLRKISAKHVLNNKGKKCVSVNAFLLAASKSYPLANFSKLRKLAVVHGYQQLSLAEDLTFILKMTKLTIFSSAKG